MPLGAARDGLIAAQARFIVPAGAERGSGTADAGHEAQVGEMEEQVARERAVLHIADYFR